MIEKISVHSPFSKAIRKGNKISREYLNNSAIIQLHPGDFSPPFVLMVNPNYLQ